MLNPQEELLHVLALRLVPGVGDQVLRNLLNHCGSASEVFRIPKGKLLRVPGIGPQTADAIKRATNLLAAEAELERVHRNGARILSWQDAAFPQRLRRIPDAPALIYSKGPASLDHPRILGIVGTRRATRYGKRVVEEFVEQLESMGCLILSGLAYGIDIHAHREAIRRKIPTVAVLGSGIDIIYPFEHTDTARTMQECGALVSEQPMGTKPESHFFPARNRIIAGLCDALLVVEAATKGGALITASLADSYHKDVFAVPGSIHDPYSSGCNQLIRQNLATLVTSAKDLTEALNWEKPVEQTNLNLQRSHNPTALSPNAERVHSAFTGHAPSHLEQLRFISGLSFGELAEALLELECMGWVDCLPGKSYRLRATPPLN